MDLCSDGHEEICYEGRNCPLCTIEATLEERDNELEKANYRIEELEDEFNKGGEV